MESKPQTTHSENAESAAPAQTPKIKKVDLFYLLDYICAPLLICAICIMIATHCFPDGGKGNDFATGLLVVPCVLSIIWWVFGGALVFKLRTKAFEKQLDAAGFTRNQTFYGRGKTVIVDLNKGEMALLFFWNPCYPYVFSASRVEKSWVDDGKMGSGFLEGSSRVSFLFIVDGVKVRIDTFISNQRFRMDDSRILKGISKANTMDQMIKKAKGASTAK